MGSYPQILEEFPFEEQVNNSLVVREPVGVVGCITPVELPAAPDRRQGRARARRGLHGRAQAERGGAAQRLHPGRDRARGRPAGGRVQPRVGSTAPLWARPSPRTPTSTWCRSPARPAAGKRVAELAAQTVKRVALELGGKSANVILDDADLEQAVTAGVNNAFLNSGQTCTAWTRMLVPRDKQDEAARIAAGVADELTPGDPFGEAARLGPLVSDAQRDRVRGYIRKGVEEGARLVTGGDEPPEGLDTGYYVRPTVFADVRSDMTIAQEEIFGPVLSILPYDDEDDAVRIANDTVYGLAGGVWSGDPERAKAVARRLRTGQVDINGGGFNFMAPVRRLQAVGPRPRARPLRARGVPRDQVAAALSGSCRS